MVYFFAISSILSYLQGVFVVPYQSQKAYLLIQVLKENSYLNSTNDDLMVEMMIKPMHLESGLIIQVLRRLLPKKNQ